MTAIASYKSDYEFGKRAEREVYDIIKERFNEPNLIHITDRYSSFDFESDTAIYELKSRNVAHNRFPSTMLPCSKVNPACEKDQVYIFYFTDGCYYIKYNADVFSTIPTGQYSRQPRAGYVDKPCWYYWIPIDLLTKIDSI